MMSTKNVWSQLHPGKMPVAQGNSEAIAFLITASQLHIYWRPCPEAQMYSTYHRGKLTWEKQNKNPVYFIWMNYHWKIYNKECRTFDSQVTSVIVCCVWKVLCLVSFWSHPTLWRPEYGSYMIEGTPGQPYGGTMSEFNTVEDNMGKRRREALSVLNENETLCTITSFPR